MKGRQCDLGNNLPYYIKPKWLKICTFCNKSSNTIEVCFKKHDLPLYLKKPNSSQVATDDQPQDTLGNLEDGHGQSVLTTYQQ